MPTEWIASPVVHRSLQDLHASRQPTENYAAASSSSSSSDSVSAADIKKADWIFPACSSRIRITPLHKQNLFKYVCIKHILQLQQHYNLFMKKQYANFTNLHYVMQQPHPHWCGGGDGRNGEHLERRWMNELLIWWCDVQNSSRFARSPTTHFILPTQKPILSFMGNR